MAVQYRLMIPQWLGVTGKEGYEPFMNNTHLLPFLFMPFIHERAGFTEVSEKRKPTMLFS